MNIITKLSEKFKNVPDRSRLKDRVLTPQQLKVIERAFAKLKQGDKSATKDLTQILRSLELKYAKNIKFIIAKSKPNQKVLNAFVITTPKGQTYMVFTQHLIDILSPKQLTAVFLHELGHLYYAHILTRVILSVVGMTTRVTSTFAGAIAAKLAMYPAIVGSLPVAILTATLFSLLESYNMRKQEYQSDAFVVAHGYGDYLRKALTKVDSPLAQDANSSFFKLLFARLQKLFNTHPSTTTRICALYKQLWQQAKSEKKRKKIEKAAVKYQCKLA